jgi:hypothetical protein
MIIVAHSAESLAPSDCAAKFAYVVERLHQPVSGPLMISLAVIMGHLLRERVPKRCPPDVGSFAAIGASRPRPCENAVCS